jgi:general secretion pathway protein A
MKVAGAPGAIFSKSAVREINRWSSGIPRIINVIADRSLLAAYTQDTRNVDKKLVKRAAAEVYGKRIVPRVERRLVAGLAVAGFLLLLLGTWRSLNSEDSWLQNRFGSVPGLTLSQPFGSGSDSVSLAVLLADPMLPRGTDAAFETLFGEWGVAFERGPDTACEQAERHYLRCWFQKGSLNQLKRLNRPAILGLIDENGDQFQAVLSGLSSDTAEFTIDGKKFRTPLEELGEYWYGDHLLLWRPGGGSYRTLTPGVEDEGVLWLRESLAWIQQTPVTNQGSAYYDAELAERVRDYQRDRRLAVDGIVGTQTQIVINTDLGSPDTPQLLGAQ